MRILLGKPGSVPLPYLDSVTDGAVHCEPPLRVTVIGGTLLGTMVGSRGQFCLFVRQDSARNLLDPLAIPL